MPDTSVLLWSAVALFILSLEGPPLSQGKPHPGATVQQNRSEASVLVRLSDSSPPNRLPTLHRRFRPLTKIRVHITPALRNALPMLILNHSQRRMMKLDQRPAIHLAQPILQIRHNRIRHEQRP